MRIFSKKDYEALLNRFDKEANEVNGTYEFIGETIKVIGNSKIIREMFDIDYEFEREFIEAISTFTEKQIGPYDTSKYFNLIPGLKKAMKHLATDCLETRRCVISFPPEHCFQTIQMIVRENTVNVVCYMRSCDAIKNLPHDIWICSKLAEMFAYYLQKTNNEQVYPTCNITMMFGSLHVFKEELDDVL